jgi:import inner membrane translocase subunit TIM8
VAETHELTSICWKKCIAPRSSGGALDKTEQSCLANCVDRFMDANLATMKHLASMRQQ